MKIAVARDTIASPRTASASEPALAVAQSLWGRGNLSPLDNLFAATALVKLVPRAGFGFIGHHLGQRLRRYAEDSGMKIDAAEAELALSRLYTSRKKAINTIEWKPDTPFFKLDRYDAFVVLQASALCTSLETVYAKSVRAVKVGGKLFAADLTGGNDTVGPASVRQRVQPLGGTQPLRTLDEHMAAIASVGFEIESTHDLTPNCLAAVRSGFFQALGMIEELRALDDTNGAQRMRAFAEQLEAWGGFYRLGEKREIGASGILAVRRK